MKKLVAIVALSLAFAGLVLCTGTTRADVVRDTPYDPGDADPGVTYDRDRVVILIVDTLAAEVRLVVQKGRLDLDGKTWIPATAVGTTTLVLRDELYTAFMSRQTKLLGEDGGSALIRIAEEQLVADGVLSGERVEPSK